MVLIVLLIGLGLFYWSEIRPFVVYRSCHKTAVNKAQDFYKEKYSYKVEEIKKGYYEKDDYELYYKQCLRKEGINK